MQKDRRRPIRLRKPLVLFLLAGILSGCLQAPTSSGYVKSPETVDSSTRPEELKVRVQDFTHRFSAVVEAAADRIAAGTAEPEVRRQALLWKMYAIPAVQMASFRAAAQVGLMDAWALCVQMRRYFTDGAGKDLFGAQQNIAVQASAVLESEIEAIAKRIARDEESLNGARNQVAGWAENRPIEGPFFTRESSMQELANRVRLSEDAVSAVVSVEQMIVDLSNRLNAYAEHLPKQTRWQGELLAADLLDRRQVVEASKDLGSLADTATRASSIIEQIPAIVERERRALIEAMARERGIILESIVRQRIETMKTVSTERVAALNSVREERIAVLENLSKERVAILDSVHAERVAATEDLRGERKAATREIEAITERTVARMLPLSAEVIDRFIWRAAQLTAAALFACALVGWIYVRMLRAPR